MDSRRIGNFRQGFAQQTECILDSGKRIRLDPWFLNQIAAAPGKGQQMPGDISAVDGGDVLGIQRMKIAGVVPVEQVAMELFEFSDRVKRSLDALGRLRRSHPREIASRQGRKEVEPDVGRRSAVSHDGLGVFLNIVWRQEMLLRGDKGLKEAPGAP